MRPRVATDSPTARPSLGTPPDLPGKGVPKAGGDRASSPRVGADGTTACHAPSFGSYGERAELFVVHRHVVGPSLGRRVPRLDRAGRVHPLAPPSATRRLSRRVRTGQARPALTRIRPSRRAARDRTLTHETCSPHDGQRPALLEVREAVEQGLPPSSSHPSRSCAWTAVSKMAVACARAQMSSATSPTPPCVALPGDG